MKTIVLETSGKHESVDFAKVYVFERRSDAEAHIAAVCTGRTKYWRHADIVGEGEEVELRQPEEA